MATRDAAVRATLENSSYIGGLRRMGDETKRFAEESRGALSKSLGDGARAGMSALSELGSEIRNTLKTAVTLGGSLSAAGLAKNAITLTASYRDLSAAIEAGTGAAKDWRAVQREVEEIGSRWKVSNEEVASSYRSLWEDIGDSEFARAGAEEVARAFRGGYGSVSALSSIVGTLNEKFGVTKEELPEAMRLAISMANKGGISIEAMGEKLGIVGASAKQLGLGGVKGFERIGAMLNVADNATGSLKKSIGAVSGLLDSLGDSDKVKNIQKAIGVRITTKGVTDSDAIEKLLAKSGGKKEILAKAFSGDQLKLISEFGATYSKAFNSMQGDVKAKTKAGLDAFHRSLDEAGRAALSGARYEEQIKSRLGEPSANLAEALNKLTASFETPQMLNALDRLAELAPKVADGLAKLLGVAVEHPEAAAATLVGAKVLPAAGGAFGGRLLKEGAERGLFGSLGQKLGGGAKTAIETAAKAAPLAEGAPLAAPAAGGVLAKLAVLLGPLGATAAAIGGVGAAVYNGVQLHKENEASGGIWKNFMDARERRTTGFGIAKPLTPEEYEQKFLKRPPAALLVPPPVPEALRPGGGAGAEAHASAAEGLKKSGRAGQDAAHALEAFTRNARAAANALRDIKPPGGATNGSRGPVSGLGNEPGGAPIPSNK